MTQARDIADSNFTTIGGLQLGGTGSANLLDDYEEGTWTATYGSSGTDTGTYTKIGNLVQVRITLDSPSQTFSQFGTLPFSAATLNAGTVGRIIGFSGETRATVGLTVNGTTLFMQDSTGGANTMTGGSGTVRLDLVAVYLTS